MVTRVMVTVIGGVPMFALFGMPCGVVRRHRDLARAVGQGGNEGREGKGNGEHECCDPCEYHPHFAHLPLWRDEVRRLVISPRGG